MRLLSIGLAFVLSQTAYAANYGSVIAEVVSVYDGDSFRVNISGWPAIIGDNVPVRVRGIDTPEIRGKCPSEKEQAIRAREFVREVLSSGVVKLVDMDRGKYFRIVATVLVDGVDLSELVIKNSLGRRYDGGRKESWCK